MRIRMEHIGPFQIPSMSPSGNHKLQRRTLTCSAGDPTTMTQQTISISHITCTS